MKRLALQRWIPFRLAALIAPLIAAWPRQVQAANGDWNVDAAGGWSTPANWQSSVIGGGSAGDTVNFNFLLSAARTITLDGNRTMGTLNVNGPAAFAYTLASLNGGSLIMDNGAGTAAINFTGAGIVAHTIQAPIVLNSNLEVSSDLGVAVPISHQLSGNITGTGSITYDSNGTHSAATVSTVGDFIARGYNSYFGGTTITEARLQAFNSWSMGTGAVTVNDGGGIYINNGGYFRNNFNLTGLGWNEGTGRLGTMRIDANSIFTGTVNLVSTASAPLVRLNSHAAATTFFNGQLTGAADVEFTTSSAAATFVLNNSTNNFTGAVRIGRALGTSSSTLAVGANNNSGVLGTGPITVDVGGTLEFRRSDNLTVSNLVAAGASTGAVVQAGLGTTTLTNSSYLHSGTTSATGLNSRLVFNPGGTGGALTMPAAPGTISSINYADLEFNASNNVNLTGKVDGLRGSYIFQNGTGTLTFSGAVDNVNARVIANTGTTVLGKTSNGGVHTLGSRAPQYALVQNGGTVQLGGPALGNDQIYSESAIRQTGGTFDLNGTAEGAGTWTGSGGIITNTNAAAANIDFGSFIGVTGIYEDVNTVGASTVIHAPNYGGVIQNGVGAVGVSKSQPGLQILSGANTYTGATAVNAGLLSITGSTAAAGTVNVTGGGLAGTGSVGNIVVANNANSSVRPGATGQDRDAVGTLNANSLTVNGGSLRLNYAAGGNDTLNLTGAANFAAASTVTPLFSSPPVIGTTTIITGGAPAVVGVVPTVTIPALSRITGGTVAAAGNNVTLTLNGLSAQSVSWAAPGTAGTWDANGLNNWTSSDSKYWNLDGVTFGGAAANTAITLNSTVTPSGITDNSTAGGYTISGSGGIAGNGTITKSGASTLILSTANPNFTGDVVVTGGTLRLGNAGALGDVSGQTFVSGGGTIDINGLSVGGAPVANTMGEIFNISGAGVGGNGALLNSSATGQTNAFRFIRLTGDATVGVTQAASRMDIRGSVTSGVVTANEALDLRGFTLSKTGAGTFVITEGVAVTDGNLTVNQGTLSIESSALVQGQGNITVNPGATLQYWTVGNGNVTRPNVWNGGTVTNLNTASIVNSPISLTGNTTLIGAGNTMTFGGNLTESGGSFGFTKNEASTYNFAGNVAYRGATTVNQGTLNLAGLNTATSSAVNTVNVTGPATLGTATPPVQGGLNGNLNLGGGGYTTIAGAPSLVTINNGTYGINTRTSNTVGSNVVYNYVAGTNQFTITGVEQDTNTTLTGSIGNTTKYGNLTVNGGTVTLSPSSALNLRILTVNNTNGAGGLGVGTSTGTLNITGGNHKLMALFTGDAGSSSGIVNMSGGTLTFENNGSASLQSTNSSGYAMFGQSGLRIGHFNNNNNVPSQFNLSGGVLDASGQTVSVGWDGAAFLNVTGGTLKALVLAVDGNGNSVSPIYNRMDVSGNARIELGWGGMPTLGSTSSINVGDSTWVAMESAEWQRGFNLIGNTTLDTGVNRVAMNGQHVGPGNLTKTGNGILQLAGANVNTGAINATAGTLRMANVQALGDGTINTVGATLDINGQQGGASSVITYRPTTITLGGTGAPGSLGGLINTSGTQGGISTDPAGSIVISGNTTAYTVGRVDLGGNIGNATFNNLISGGANTLTKNGQGALMWRGTSASSIGNVIVNGGQFYTEENDNNLGATGSLTANRGGMISAWQSDTTTTQNKPVVLNGGAILADRNSTWTGGLTVTADSKAFRNAANADARLTFDGPLNLGAGTTLTVRDRLPNPTTFTNNPSSGNGSLDVHSHTVILGPNSNFGGAGEIKIRNDALVTLDATATLTKAVNLAGGTLSDTTATARALTVNSTGSGYLRTINAGGSMSLGALNVLGSAATVANTRYAGMMFGSGTGYTANAAPGAAMGAITLTNNSVLANNPNFTVSSNPFLTAGNDTTFAMWDGSKVTGVAPTQAAILGSGPADLPMVIANETVTASQTINNLITDATVTLNVGVTLTLGGGGVILREVTGAGWNGSGFLTSGRKDGVLALTMTNAYTSALALGGGDVGGFTVGNISNNPLPAGAGAFRPVTVVVNGFGNTTSTVNQTYTGGLVMNGGRINQSGYNTLGLGPVTVREGGTILVNTATGVSNNFSASGLGQFEGGGTLFGALRFGGGGGMGNATGTISLDSPVVRLIATDNTTILGNVVGSGTFQRTGGGTMFVRSALGYTGATQLGIDGSTLGTHTVFTLANGGSPSSLGASSSAASNLVFQSGTLNYIGGGASTDRLFTIAPSMTTSAPSVTIANNGYGNLSFTNPGAVVMGNGSTDATLTLSANNFTQNVFTPQLSDPSGARLNINVNGPQGSWTLNGSSYNIAGAVSIAAGSKLILDSTADLTIPVLNGAARAYLVKNGNNTLTLGGSGLLAEADNNTGQLIVNSGTVIFDKRGANPFTNGSAAGPGATGARMNAIGGNGPNNGDAFTMNGGTVRYAPTANLDQIFDNVDVRINGGTLDFNGRRDTFDALNGTGGRLTNGMAGTTSIVGIGANGGLPSTLNFRAIADYGGVIEDGAGQIELVKIGSGTQALSGNNTYTGKTAVLAGFLQLDSETRLGSAPASLVLNQLSFNSQAGSTGAAGLSTNVDVTIDDANRGVWVNGGITSDNSMRPAAGTTLTFASPVRGNGGFQAVGAGTLRLSGANIYTGTTAVYRGTLALDYGSQNNSKLADGSALILRGGNVLLSNGSHTEIVSGTTIDGNIAGTQNSGSTNITSSAFTGRLRMNAITRTMGGTINLDSGIADTDTGNNNTILAGANAAYATVGKNTWAVSAATAADTVITGLAAGGYALNNYATPTNHVDVTADSAFGVAPAVSTLRFNGVATNLDLDTQVLTLNQQGILIGSGAAAGSSITNGSISSAALGAAATTDLIIHQHSASPFTIDAALVSGTNNTTGLTKAGNGTLILTSAGNSYAGVTHINEGTLELQGAGVLGNNSTAAVWVDGTLSLNRTGAYTINNNMGGYGTILKRDNTGVATLTGIIGNTPGFSGDAVISQGTLITTGEAFNNAVSINDNPASGTVYGTITLGDAGTGPTDDVIYLDGRAVAHTIRKDIVIANTGSTGAAVIGSSTLKAATNTIFQGNMVMNRATTLRGDGNDRTTFQGVLSGNVGTLTIDAPNVPGVVINTNPGRVTLENSNTFVGNVQVNGAILQVGTGNLGDPQDQIPDTANVQLNGVSATKQAGLTLSGDGEAINNLNGDVNTFIQSALSSNNQMMRLTVLGTGTFSGLFHGGNNTGMTLEKAGTGTFSLEGTADNNTGRVLVSSGTLRLAKTSTGAVHAVAVDATITGGTMLLAGTGGDQIYDGTNVTMYGGTLDMGGTNEGFQSLFGNAGTVTNSGGATSTLTLGNLNNASSLFGGTIQNGASPIALTKVGNGGAVLTGANTYGGVTTITGGYIQLGNGGATGSIAGTSNVVTSANTQLVFNRSNNVTFAPVISGAGGLVQNGTGILEIPAGTINTFTGPTVINSGEYKMNGSAVASPITLNPGAILSGSGIVGAVGSNGGVIAPGNSPGILRTGSVVTNDATTFQFEINGTTAGVTHDQLNTTGIIDLDGTLVISLGYTPVYGDKVFAWLNDGADAITGTWTGLSEGSLIPAGGDKTWILSYNDDSVGNPTAPSNHLGNDVSLYLVPEAGSSALLLLAATGLLARRRRQHA